MGRTCASCGNWCSNSRFSANQWRKGEGSSRCKDCVQGGQGVQCSEGHRVPKHATAGSGDSRAASLQCSEGHRLQKHHTQEDWFRSATCDRCGYAFNSASLWQEFYGCRECNVDICVRCSGIVTQAEMDGIPSNRTVIQACCMVAIATVHPHDEQAQLTAAARGERYNGKRPNYRGRRVSRHDYPDPTDFMWTFTGSCEGGRAEFFEKDFVSHGIVKLDFYYTTGTVKTVLDHPTQGVTQLFAKGDSLSPEMYRAILTNPRQHTGKRYHLRPR